MDKIKGKIFSIINGKVSEQDYSYPVDKKDKEYLFGKGKDGGVGFCLKAIGLYHFYKENKSKLKRLSEEIEEMNDRSSNKIAPLDIHLERIWVKDYENLLKKLSKEEVALLTKITKREKKRIDRK